MADPRWLLLIHQLPPKPLYLRAKIRHRLARVGALALKNSVYVLPDTEDCLEDFEWIAEEARAGGGEAFVSKAEFLDGVDDRGLMARFRRERSADWGVLATELRRLSALRRKPGDAAGARSELEAGVARVRRRLEEIRSIDFFEAPGKKEAETMLQNLDGKLRSKSGEPPRRRGARGDLAGKTWVTRRGIKIDRIASAWLVRRFIDPAARFRFVDPAADPRKPGELRFDMVGGDFTHEGDRCTFETLRLRAGVEDPALGPIAEIVHDIDLKDGKYGRPDAAGVKQLVEGLLAAHSADEERLGRGFALFDDLYSSFRGRGGRTTPKRKKRRARKN